MRCRVAQRGVEPLTPLGAHSSASLRAVLSWLYAGLMALGSTTRGGVEHPPIDGFGYLSPSTPISRA